MTSPEGFPFLFSDRGKRTFSQRDNIKTLRDFNHLTPITFVRYAVYAQTCACNFLKIQSPYFLPCFSSQSLRMAPQNKGDSTTKERSREDRLVWGEHNQTFYDSWQRLRVIIPNLCNKWAVRQGQHRNHLIFFLTAHNHFGMGCSKPLQT